MSEKPNGGNRQKPRLSFWQIWNMSFGFLGIQFGFALQNANVSRIFETLGASVDDIPILWVAAPVTGLIVQPIVGYFSDRTWTRLGRRRPFFLVGAILASIALIFMPNSWELWVAAGMLWIMDASINISMEPFRAFVGDLLPDSQRTTGFAMQSFFIGIGAVVASALPYMLTNWFGVSNTAPEGVIPDSVKWSFYIGGAVFFLSVLVTIITTKEYSPEDMDAYEAARSEESSEELRQALAAERKEFNLLLLGSIWTLIGAILLYLVFTYNLEKGLYILSGGIAFFGLIQLGGAALKSTGYEQVGFVTIVEDLYNMPKTMGQLAVVQFFSWFALFAMWIYTTSAVTSHVYDMRLEAGDLNELYGYYQEMPDKGDKAEKIDREFEKYLESAQGQQEVKVDIDFTNYFLDGRIIDKERLVQILSDAAEKVGASERLEKAKSHLDELVADIGKAREANRGLSSGVSHSTLNFFLQNHPETLELSEAELEELQMVSKLKYVQEEYNDGADWVGILFAAYNLFAALVAFLLPVFAKVITRRGVHAVCLILGGLGLASIYIIGTPEMLLVSMLGIGIAWASILSMPYAILSGALPAKKMGLYMGIFNFFIVIPQIVAASILGFFMSSLFGNQAVMALILGGASMVVAAIMVLFVKDVAEKRAMKDEAY